MSLCRHVLFRVLQSLSHLFLFMFFPGCSLVLSFTLPGVMNTDLCKLILFRHVSLCDWYLTPRGVLMYGTTESSNNAEYVCVCTRGCKQDPERLHRLIHNHKQTSHLFMCMKRDWVGFKISKSLLSSHWDSLLSGTVTVSHRAQAT